MNNLGAHRDLAWALRDVVIGLPDRMTVPVSPEAAKHAKAFSMNNLGAHRDLAWAIRDVVIGLRDRMKVPASREAAEHAKTCSMNNPVVHRDWRERSCGCWSVRDGEAPLRALIASRAPALRCGR
jgi:hypothetical protein